MRTQQAMGQLVLACLILACLALPTTASAVVNWQAEETLPSGTSSSLVWDQRDIQLDASGNALLTLGSSGSSRWGYRPAGGPLSASKTWPAGSDLASYPAQFALDGSGNAIAWDSGWYWSAYRPAGIASSFGNEQGFAATPATLYDVAVAPTGESFGFFKSGNNGLLAFRAAGAAQTFDLAGASVITPGVDTSITPIGITIDADGQAAAVYKSTPSNSYFQVVRSGPTWGSPTQITGIPAGAGAIFDHAADGTAVVGFISTTKATASVRAPGGSFGAPGEILTAPAGSEIGVSPLVAAVNGGGAVVAFNRTRNRAGCGPSGDYKDTGWEAYRYSSLTWALLTGGPSSFPGYSGIYALDAAGSRIAFATHSGTFTGGAPCDYGTGGVTNLEVALGTVSGIESTATLVPSGLDSLSFLGVGPSGSALVGYWRDSQDTQYLRAYEEPGTGGTGGTGSPGGGSVTNPPAGLPAITAPSKVTLSGTIVVRNKIVSLPMQCESAYLCNLVVSLFQAKPKGSTVVSAAPKALATVKVTIAPGATKKVKLKIPASVLKKLKKSGSHTVSYYFQTRTTAGGSSATVVQKRKLKLG